MTFFRGSRYAEVGEIELEDANGRLVRCKRLRLVPDTPGRFMHVVSEHERVDLIAHRYFRDSELFWRVCDANEAMWPPDLIVPGRQLDIPAAEGS